MQYGHEGDKTLSKLLTGVYLVVNIYIFTPSSRGYWWYTFKVKCWSPWTSKLMCSSSKKQLHGWKATKGSQNIYGTTALPSAWCVKLPRVRVKIAARYRGTGINGITKRADNENRPCSHPQQSELQVAINTTLRSFTAKSKYEHAESRPFKISYSYPNSNSFLVREYWDTFSKREQGELYRKPGLLCTTRVFIVLTWSVIQPWMYWCITLCRGSV
jgi:hypothetical protein